MTLIIQGLTTTPTAISERYFLKDDDSVPIKITLANGTEVDDWYHSFIGEESQITCRFHREEEIRYALKHTIRRDDFVGVRAIRNVISRNFSFIPWIYKDIFLDDLLNQTGGIQGELFRIMGIDPITQIVNEKRMLRLRIFDEERLISLPDSEWYIVDDVRVTDELATTYGAENILLYHNGLRLVNKNGVKEDTTVVTIDERMNSENRPKTPDAWISYIINNTTEWDNELAPLAESTTKFYLGNYEGDLRHSPGEKRFNNQKIYSSENNRALSISSKSHGQISLWVRTKFIADQKRTIAIDFGLSRKVDGNLQYKYAMPSKLGLTIDPEVSQTTAQSTETALKNRILQMSERAFRTIAYREGISEVERFQSQLGYSGSSSKNESYLSDIMWIKAASGTVIEGHVLRKVRQLNWWVK